MSSSQSEKTRVFTGVGSCLGELRQALAADPHYRDRDWAAIEAEGRRDWEQRHQGSWEEVKEAIHSFGFAIDLEHVSITQDARVVGLQNGFGRGRSPADGTLISARLAALSRFSPRYRVR
jgi:hypothetical protein